MEELLNEIVSQEELQVYNLFRKFDVNHYSDCMACETNVEIKIICRK